MIFTHRTCAGALIFIGTAWLFMGIVVSEALYPGYHVTQMISDLGVGSTAPIFNSAIFGFGLLVLVSAFLLHATVRNQSFLFLLALTGIGAAGVGIFPETVIVLHSVCAITVFVCGGLCANLGFRIFAGLWSWFSTVLGIIALVAIVLLGSHIWPGLGAGGMERMIVYPLILWAFGTGAYLMAGEPV